MKHKVTFHFQHPEQSSGYLLWQVGMLWQRQMNRALAEVELTHTQFVILAALGWLANEQEEVTQIDIAHHSKTDRMMVSKVIGSLEEKGLIARSEHSKDTRAKSVSLTQEGAETLQKALVLVEQTDQLFFGQVANHSGSLNDLMKMLFV